MAQSENVLDKSSIAPKGVYHEIYGINCRSVQTDNKTAVAMPGKLGYFHQDR